MSLPTGINCPAYKDRHCTVVTQMRENPICPYVGESSISCKVITVSEDPYYLIKERNVTAEYSITGSDEDTVILDKRPKMDPKDLEELLSCCATPEPPPRRSNQEFLDGIQRRHQRRSRRR